MSSSRYHIFFDSNGDPVARINEATLGLAGQHADLMYLRRFFARQLAEAPNRPERRVRLLIEHAIHANDGSIRWSAPDPMAVPAVTTSTSANTTSTPTMTATTTVTAPVIMPTITASAANTATQAGPDPSTTPAFTEEERQELVAQREARERKESDEVREKFEAMLKKRDDRFKKGGAGTA